MNKKPKLIFKFFILFLFLLLIFFITIKYTPIIYNIISDPEKFKIFLNSYGKINILVFIFFQALQVIIAAIPGELIQIAGGYIYGIYWGTLYSLIGIFIGSVVTFFISRIFGFSIIKSLFPKNQIDKFRFLINNRNAEIALFVLFLIPGIPKDVLVYISGLTPIKPIKFFLISMTARFPAILASSYIGTSLQQKNYSEVVAISALAVMLFVLGILTRDKIINKLMKFLNKK